MTRQLDWDRPDPNLRELAGAVLILLLGAAIVVLFTAAMPPAVFVAGCGAVVLGLVMMFVRLRRWFR